jgi:hypothetical protein
MTSYAVCGGSKKELLWSGLIGRLCSRRWPARDKAPTVDGTNVEEDFVAHDRSDPNDRNGGRADVRDEIGRRYLPQYSA